MGRPKLHPGDARDVYPLRLSAREKLNYMKAAAIVGTGLPEWIRKTLTSEALQTIRNTESGDRGDRTPGDSNAKSGAPSIGIPADSK